ncbi:pantoate--beta-alanine ligase [Agriterribacter sp.]|uniref:pantoate--beta-alanine ligase n=1 Tax=Agriterribacter sp. TaxID=2821509 RepID=UPI002D1D48F1|nr:pantoate--beta-alanine ligase [Agriterribacter sp.]HRP58219.1 pantoate--beta-alanine ligase [Agriterribacter sp.]
MQRYAFFAETAVETLAITTFNAIMFIIKQSKDLARYLQKQRSVKKTIGFIPTMGALHQGHLSLTKKAGEENGVVVCSIFVNPTQFNDLTDFELYPKTLESDILLLEKQGCDLLFLPDVAEIYPSGISPATAYELGYLESVLEGKYRPGHFQGVCQVMHRLMEIVRPDRLYLGQKDYQQCLVIGKLLELIQSPAEIIICPTLREPGGLAMSSRNLRLSAREKQNAQGIYEALSYISRNIKPGEVKGIAERAGALLIQKELTADYLTIARAEDLRIIDVWDGQTKAIALIAAFMGKVRLIDNMII